MWSTLFHQSRPFKPFQVMMRFIAVLTAALALFAGVQIQAQIVYRVGSTDYSQRIVDEVHVSKSGPRWQGNDFYNNPIAASRVTPVREYRSTTQVDLGFWRYFRLKARTASSTAILPDGTSVTSVTHTDIKEKTTRPPYVIVPTYVGAPIVGIQPSYIDNTRGGGWSAGSSATIIHHSYNPSLR